LHDDLMDCADLRRGCATVHKRWDANTAILSGDSMLVLAYQRMATCRADYLKEVIDLFTQTALEIGEGQQYDMEFETRDDVTEEEYIQMIYLKTSVLIAGSMRHGALIAGAPEHEYKELYDFGGYLGLVFQLQDDYLDVYGDVEEFGKKIGGDILCNKKTYLLIKAFELASEEDKALLKEWVVKEKFNPQEKIKEVTEIYNRSGVKEALRAKVDDYLEKSRIALDKIEVPEERKVRFYEMIDFIGKRKK